VSNPFDNNSHKPRRPNYRNQVSESEVYTIDNTLGAREGLDDFAPKKRGWGITPYMRVWIATGIMSLISVALMVNLFHWQVERGKDLAKEATKQNLQTSDTPARRGLIYDSNGQLLASNSLVYLVWGAPREVDVKKVDSYASRLASYLPDTQRQKIVEALTPNTDKDRQWNLIATGVSPDIAEKIRQDSKSDPKTKEAPKLNGVSLESKARRVYPNNTMLANLLGFANFEMVGAYGVEGYYNKVLSGQPGKVVAVRDAYKAPIALGAQQISQPVDGGDLYLTVDTAIQAKVEKEVLATMFQYGASAASAIVMNPQTGAILAWVSYPDYDPNKFYETDNKRFLDPMVSAVYEPGSTFKIFTAAIGIDTGAVTPDSAANLPGCVIKYGFTVCNYNRVGYDNQTVAKTLQKSSNVGAMWIVEKYGPQKYYPYMKNFGFGQSTGIDLASEGEGIVRWPENPSWSMLDLDMNSFGQAIAVTPLQLITGVSAVANGGKLMKPYVVDRITRDNKVIEQTKPTVVRQVISPESAKTTTDMLVQAVKGGETRLADVKGYLIAGKTGTAQIAGPNGGYLDNIYIGSTIAYAPANNPQFVVLVRLDRINTFGSNTAAPAVKNIIEFLFHYYNIPPTEQVVETKKP